MDSYKTELISDRVWRSRSQLELATVEYVSWFNHERLHEALGDIPPVEFEQLHAATAAPISPFSVDGSVTALSPRAADGLTTRRLKPVGVDFAVRPLDLSENDSGARSGSAQAAPQAGGR